MLNRPVAGSVAIAALLSLFTPARTPAVGGEKAADLALQPPAVNTAPGPRYADDARDVNMVLGMDRTPGGRIWACWISGGDSELGYLVAATSDDKGDTWSRPRLVIDPSDAPNGLPRRALVGNFWTDPSGRLWLLFDQSMGYFDGRAGVWAITCDKPDAERPKWSPPRRIWHGATLNKPLVLNSGQWLLPARFREEDVLGSRWSTPGTRQGMLVNRATGKRRE